MFIENEFYHEYLSITRNSPYKSKFSTEDKDYVYLESHHIIPKSMGGDDSSENLVLLTAQDHYRCHELLPFFTEGEDRVKMIIAWWRMACCNKNKGIKISSESYSTLKEAHAKRMSSLHKGKTISEKHKKAISNANKNKILTKKSRELISNRQIGKNNCLFKGKYITPLGIYDTAKEASNAFNEKISCSSIIKWCKSCNHKKITIHSLKQSEYLKSLDNSIIGKTYKELGFTFEEK